MRLKQVKIIEVGPRDGLQNEVKILDIDTKVQFIMELLQAGCHTVELTSFVRPDKIPQMQDAAQCFERVKQELGQKFNEYSLPCLVPNIKGYENSQNVGVQEIALFTATSEEFNKKNINATIEESLERFDLVMAQAKADQVKVRGYISTVFGCPYEGETSVDILYKLCEHLLNQGVYEISLGDTIGVAHPEQVENILAGIKSRFATDNFALHFHDTHGRAIANIYQAYKLGFGAFDASAGGLGGCPYAKGATGNVATEDVLALFDKMGVTTGIDIRQVAKASQKVLEKLNRTSESKIHQLLVNH